MKSYLLSLFLLLTIVSNAATYYVDAATTSLTQNGSAANPWKTLAQVSSNQNSFQPGDFVLFKRGGVYTGTFYPTRGGTASAPLTFGAYGSGAKPKFTGTGSRIGYLFYVQDKDYIIFRDMWITDPSIDENNRSIDAKIQRAFTFDEAANNCRIVACDISLVGVAGYFIGASNTMDSCDVGNLRMVVDTDQGYQPGNDDDYGANPLVISSANNTVTHNNFHDCWATSFDYSYDGGALEFYGDGVDNNFIAYNTMSDNLGICEINGNSSNNTWAYNKMVNNGSLFYFQSGSTYTNNKFYNNVVIENTSPRLAESRLIGGSLGSSALILKNNIFNLSTGTDVANSTSGITHEDNIYKLSNNSIIGYTAGASELSTSVALFTNTSSASPLSWNFVPVSGSPAIDFGQNVGLTKDFAGNTVPGVPNSGILESGGTAPGNPLSASSTASVIACNGGSATVTVTASGGTSPYTGTGTFSKVAGTYNFAVTDATGASATTSITIVQPAVMNVSVVAGTAPSQTGTAAATITASGGTPTYTYSLDGGAYQSSNTFTAVSVGAHSVVVRDGKACTITKSFNVSAAGASPLVISAVSSTISCYGEKATVTISASGGRAPYTGTGTFQVAAGTYTYTVTDANGTTGTYTVAVSQPAAITATVSASAITVLGGVSVATVTVSGGTAPYTYQLASGGFQSGNSFSNLSVGAYTFTIKDARGCTKTASVTITQTTAPTSFKINLVSKRNATCSRIFDGKIVVSATGGTSPYQYKINSGSYRTSGTFRWLAAGTYTVTAKDASGLTSSISVVIAVNSTSCWGRALQAGDDEAASDENVIAKSGDDVAKSIPVPEMKGESRLKVFPNPTSSTWSVLVENADLNEPAMITLSNISGQIVYSSKTRLNQKIVLGNNLVAGVYILQVMQGGRLMTEKIIKAK